MSANNPKQTFSKFRCLSIGKIETFPTIREAVPTRLLAVTGGRNFRGLFPSRRGNDRPMHPT